MTAVRTIFSVSLKILGQGLLALTSFIVSFAAAHSLSTRALAVFFVAWTLETMWIAAVRGVLVPGIIVTKMQPNSWALLGTHSLLVAPMSGAVFLVANVGGLGWIVAALLALTPLSLGSYELGRTYLSKFAGGSITTADCIMLGIAGTVSFVGWNANRADLLLWALVGLIAGSFVVCLLASYHVERNVDCDQRMGLVSWFKDNIVLMRTGLFEWTVFFAVSMISVGILGFLGGAEVLAGIRLAETLLAPLVIAGSAIPLILSPYVSSVNRGHIEWPRIAAYVSWAFSFGAVLWVCAILILPLSVLEMLVGEHGLYARRALVGLSLGVMVSFFSVTFTLFFKVRGYLKELRVVRWVQLCASIPIIAVASVWGDVLVAAIGISVHQLLVFGILWGTDRSLRSRPSGCGA